MIYTGTISLLRHKMTTINNILNRDELTRNLVFVGKFLPDNAILVDVVILLDTTDGPQEWPEELRGKIREIRKEIGYKPQLPDMIPLEFIKDLKEGENLNLYLPNGDTIKLTAEMPTSPRHPKKENFEDVLQEIISWGN